MKRRKRETPNSMNGRNYADDRCALYYTHIQFACNRVNFQQFQQQKFHYVVNPLMILLVVFIVSMLFL